MSQKNISALMKKNNRSKVAQDPPLETSTSNADEANEQSLAEHKLNLKKEMSLRKQRNV
jgi:hypothetical protein